ncbi:MAG: hypothetical protein H0T79_22625 [Deltaproteobacteria bacterium]|nr:hypothetical protein [Deltaproteobacteria bacterium]
MTRRIVIRILVLGAVAGCEDDAALDAPEARDIYARSTELLHALHNEAIAMPAWPATHALPCPDGGRVVMTTAFATGGTPEDLRHTFDGCVVGGWTLGGDLDYLGVAVCDDSTYSFDIAGSLAVAGRGTCGIDAREMCGVTTGTACGVTL